MAPTQEEFIRHSNEATKEIASDNIQHLREHALMPSKGKAREYFDKAQEYYARGDYSISNLYCSCCFFLLDLRLGEEFFSELLRKLKEFADLVIETIKREVALEKSCEEWFFIHAQTYAFRYFYKMFMEKRSTPEQVLSGMDKVMPYMNERMTSMFTEALRAFSNDPA